MVNQKAFMPFKAFAYHDTTGLGRFGHGIIFSVLYIYPMINTIEYNSFPEFWEDNEETFYNHYFTYFHLFSVEQWVLSGRYQPLDGFKITDAQNRFIIACYVTENYFLYSDGWSEEMLQTLVDRMGLANLPSIFLNGQKGLIQAVLLNTNTPHTLIKDRLIYECDAVLPLKKDAPGVADFASQPDYDELVEMDIAYYYEEYPNGRKERQVHEQSTKVGIENESIFIWKDNDTITSMVKRINDDEFRAMIGSFFTKPEQRKNGYGYALLHSVTNSLLGDEYECCGLLSDATDPTSNNIFAAIGYKPVYEWAVFKKTA